MASSLHFYMLSDILLIKTCRRYLNDYNLSLSSKVSDQCSIPGVIILFFFTKYQKQKPVNACSVELARVSLYACVLKSGCQLNDNKRFNASLFNIFSSSLIFGQYVRCDLRDSSESTFWGTAQLLFRGRMLIYVCLIFSFQPL